MEGMSSGHTGRNDIKSYHLRRPNAVLLPDQLGQFLLAIMHLVIFFNVENAIRDFQYY